MKELITRYENDVIIELNSDNSTLYEMIEDLALRNSSDDRTVFRLTFENGTKVIRGNGYVGLVQFNDGTQLEIYPKLGDGMVCSKKMLGKLMSAYLDIPFEASLAAVLEKPESSFMEFFISVFVRECMKILKSGLLSGYTSIEENTTAMQGSIVFSENIRKNLTHRERLYVRHDVFTPDRSENRLIKSAAMVMQKLTRDHQNEQNLKKILIFLDEVNPSVNYSADFANCVNTRNAKKYTAVLNICRMMLRKGKNGFEGKYVKNAILFPMSDIFTAYIMKQTKAEYRGSIVRSKPQNAFLCEDKRLFPVSPSIAVYEADNSVSLIIEPRWKRLREANNIPAEDIYRLCIYAKKLDCRSAVIIFPSNTERDDMVIDTELDGNIRITVKYAALAPDMTGEDDFYDEPVIDEDEEEMPVAEEDIHPEEDISETEDAPADEETEETADEEAVEDAEIPEEEAAPEKADEEETPAPEIPVENTVRTPKKIKLIKKAKK